MLLELVQVGTRYGVRATIPRESRDLELWYDRNAESVSDVRHIRSKCLFGNINRPRWIFNQLKARAERDKPIGPTAGDTLTVIETYGE